VDAVGDKVNSLDGEAVSDLPDHTRLARLAQEQAALRRIATLVAAGAAPRQAFAAVAEEAGRLFLVDVANVCRYEPEGMAAIVASVGDRLAVGSRVKLEGNNLATLVYQTGQAARMDRYAERSSGPFGVVGREQGVPDRARSARRHPAAIGRAWPGGAHRGGRCSRRRG